MAAHDLGLTLQEDDWELAGGRMADSSPEEVGSEVRAEEAKGWPRAVTENRQGVEDSGHGLITPLPSIPGLRSETGGPGDPATRRSRKRRHLAM